MKRFLSTTFIVLALLVSAAGAAPVAHAQTCPAGFDYDENDGCQPISTGSGTCRYGYVYVDENTGCIPADTPSTLSGLTDSQQSAAAGTVTNPTLGGDMESQFGKVMIWIMTLFAWLVGVAAITLDNAVYYTVVTMGNFIHNLSAVGVSWRILRDIGNIMLIFGFLSVGITTILNVDWYGFTTKMLPMLLVSAVFLNFSLFFTEAIIDTGNLFATQFYTQINGGQPAGVKNFDLVSVNNDGISNKIMAQLGLQSIYGDVMRNEKLVIAGNSWVIGFMGIILFLVTAFVMFSLAFVLIARFVILLFLIIVAPIGWAALAIPKLRNLSDKWWSELFEQTITAPVLLLCLYIALAVITDAQFLTGFGVNQNTGGWTGWITNATGTSNLTGLAAMILSFLVATGLLLAVVIISKKMSAFGGGLATKAAGALTFGAAAFAGRRTVGRVSNYAARKIRSSKYGNNEVGRVFAGLADRGAKANFDIRGSEAFKNIPFGGVDAGAPKKGGYRAREEELVKSRTDYAKSLTQSSSQKVALERAKETEGAKFEANMKPLREQEQAQLEETKRLVDASRAEVKLRQQEAQAARASGDTGRITTAETALNSAIRAQEDLKQAQKEKLDPIREKIQGTKDDYEKAIRDATKANSKEARQEAYGKGLQSKTLFGIIPRAPYDWPTTVGSARREAAGKIIRDAGKDDAAKLRDLLEASLNKKEPESAPAEKKP
ncbi:MAG: hypothetical protein G01um101491_86, partial [Parcubacteria group bacterium Gr01-1014_91]